MLIAYHWTTFTYGTLLEQTDAPILGSGNYVYVAKGSNHNQNHHDSNAA
jgi:hypothetical protein